MLKIRFARGGRKKVPFFRIVLTEHQRAASHGYQKILGFYNPLSKELKFDADQAKQHIAHGAQLSESLAKVLTRNNITL